MKFAAIDIGTNTLRLLIAEKAPTKHAMKPLGYKRTITRLGGGYTEDKGIDAESAERTFRALEDFKADIDKHEVEPEHIRAVATSVVRKAGNAEWFIEEVKKRTGLIVEVISGVEEARLSFMGVVFVLETRGLMDQRRLVMDIGGGSTEFIISSGMEIKAMWSTELGVVALTEKHLQTDPPTKDELSSLGSEVDAGIDDLKRGMGEIELDPGMISKEEGFELVGTAGTITTLAAIGQKLTEYAPHKVNNYILTKVQLKDIYENLLSMPNKERLNIIGIEAGREDLIISGCVVAQKVMDAFGFEFIKVSDGGLLEGIILKEIWSTGPPESGSVYQDL